MVVKAVSLLSATSLCITAIFLYYVNFISLVNITENDELTNFSYITSIKRGSSIWCKANENKFCAFKNLCYAPFEKQFVFILTNNSEFHGIRNIQELKSIDLSSISHHNAFLMKLAIVSSDNPILKRNMIFKRHVFIMWRFKWDNIMHVIHDDLFPLYTTYAHICQGNVDECISKYNIGFADEGNYGPLSEWYRIFSKSELLLLNKNNKEDLICFEESQVGLSRESVWFQYGFGIPQGPIVESKLTGHHMRKFSDFVLRKFNIQASNFKLGNIVLFSRKINRKIVNEHELLMMINSAYRTNFPSISKVQAFKMDIVINNTRQILQSVVDSNVIVGMHGSAMIMSLFLKPGSAVVELFPFGINPEYVSAIQALCKISDVGLIYNSWVNNDAENTVVFPNAPSLHGGINHLSNDEQKKIKSLNEIPAVECCHNAAYLYRMFQDTFVGSDVILVLNKTFYQQKTFLIDDFNKNVSSSLFSTWYFPAPVSNIICKSSGKTEIVITWTPSLNVYDPEYHIALVGSNKIKFSAIVNKSEFKISLPSSVEGIITLDLWIKCVHQEKESLDMYAQCTIDI